MLGINTTVKLFLLMLIIGSVSVGYIHYQNLVQDKKDALRRTSQLQTAVDVNETTIDALQKDIEQSNRIRQQVEIERNQALARNQELERILMEHDLGTLARARPGLVEKAINNGTADANRCLEIMSGSPLTSQEKNARLPSEVNGFCPGLANPNRRDR